MIDQLRSEFRKLLTVRSTYFISLGFLLLVAFLAFYVDGFKIVPVNIHGALAMAQAKLYLAGRLTQIANILSVSGGLIGLLLLTHEYRYSTMVYTLTATSRSKVLLSKIIAIFTCVLIYTVVATIIALFLVKAGAAASGHSLPAQNINYLTFIAKAVFYTEGFALGGLLFAALIRNQVGAIVALFIIPNPVEGILSLILKHNSVYLPFTALQQVIQPPVIEGAHLAHAVVSGTGVLSASRGALVFLGYLVVGWIIAWYLFLHRDAT